MGKGTWLGLVLAGGAAVSVAACGGDTGILLDISMSSTLDDQLATNGADFDTLRIYVGHQTEIAGVFTSSPDAFASVARTRASMAGGFRYLVEPDGDLDAIGDLMFAAAVGDDLGARLPFRVRGFAVSDAPLGFATGEVRVVTLTLEPPVGVLTGLDQECIAWGTDGNLPGRITPVDDRDCDGAVGSADCDDQDPLRNQLDIDQDGVTSCDGDCLELPVSGMPWLDPASVHPGADDTTPDAETCDHVDHDCDGTCGDLHTDSDQSGSTECGKAGASASAVCQVLPADCDESTAGNNPDAEGAGEACNGRDDACDGFLPPAIPCLYRDAGACRVGQVACDELRGTFAGQPDALVCSDLPGGFSNLPADVGLCSMSYSPSCLDSPDPVACGTSTAQVLSSACTINAVLGTGDCVPDRTLLSLPDTLLPATCAWTIVGGIEQAEWQIGFVDPNSPGTTVPTHSTTACRPTLAVGSRVLNPVARAVLLLLASPDNTQFPVRGVVVHLQPGTDGCTGLAVCTTPGG